MPSRAAVAIWAPGVWPSFAQSFKKLALRESSHPLQSCWSGSKLSSSAFARRLEPNSRNARSRTSGGATFRLATLVLAA
jgi:hypothetical protein